MRLLAAAAFAVTIALLVTGYVLDELSPAANKGGGWNASGVVSVLYGVTLCAFPAVGLILALRRPGNAIGWLLLAVGVAWGIANATAYADYGLLQHPGSLPAAPLVAVISSSFWLPPIGLSGTFLLLLFPDGRLLSPRWRPVAWLSAGTIIAGTVSLAITPGLMGDAGYPRTSNPLGISRWATIIDASHALIILLPVMMVLAAVSLVLRFRRSHGDARQQVKWLAAAAAAVAGIYAVVEPLSVVLVPSGGHTPVALSALQDIALCSFGLIPIAIAFAILRYRLYEIDRLVSRTLSYACLTALLAGLYAGMIALATDVLPVSSPVAVAASTLTVAALFNPLRRRLQRLVDRRFNRARYDAEQVAAAFNAHLQDAVDLDAVCRDLLDAVRSMQPRHASVWIRPRTSHMHAELR